MSLVNDGNGGMVMPVGPMYGGNGGNGMGWNGDGSFWIIILFLFAMFGNGWGGFGANNGNQIPYILNNTQSDVQRGFDQQSIMSGIAGINSSLSAAEVSRCNAQANVLQALNQNQASVNQTMNSLAMSLQNCCCENRAGLADLKYTVATEACSDRQAVTNALYDVTTANNVNTQQLMNAINNGIQSIRDDICQEKIENLKAQNQALQNQLYMSNLAASQTAQTGQLLQDNAAQTANLIRTLNPTPVPAYMVQNPNCCQTSNYGCGCGTM